MKLSIIALVLVSTAAFASDKPAATPVEGKAAVSQPAAGSEQPAAGAEHVEHTKVVKSKKKHK